MNVNCLVQMKERMDNQRIIDAHNKDAKFECISCGKEDLPYNTVSSFTHVRGNDGLDTLVSIGQAVDAEGKVVFTKKYPFVVCSEECRKYYVKNCPYYYNTLMDGVELPDRIPLPVTLESLRDEHNSKKIDGIKERLDGKKGFFLQGIPGSGKTVMSAALAWEYRKRELSVKFISFKQLHTALATTYDIERHLDALVYRAKRTPWDVVIIDDICTTFPGHFGQERMLLLFDEWYNRGVKLVISSNESTETVGKAIADRVLSRMYEMMTIVAMPDIDYRKQVAEAPKVEKETI